ncbi:helix-turn-helix domain-containing protein [Bdellovibrio sp.]|uniref:helix-turn-helix domain-containing protein n=1 Tax=Bdellovibrio sp. TaxID=28201 RepID=UPI0039E2B521
MSRLERQGWMKTDQVAEYLGTSPNNVRNMIYRNYLRPKRYAGRWYFNREEIDRLINGGTR